MGIVAVYFLCSLWIGTWWYPFFRSIELNTFIPLSSLLTIIGCLTPYLSGTVTLLRPSKAETSRFPPPRFGDQVYRACPLIVSLLRVFYDACLTQLLNARFCYQLIIYIQPPCETPDRFCS